MQKELLLSIPAINDFLETEYSQILIKKFSRTKFLEVLRKELNKIRCSILSDNKEMKIEKADLEINIILDSVARSLDIEAKKGLIKVINASGVIIHTNLGRSLLAKSAIKKAVTAAGEYSTLEFNLDTGERGYRYKKIKEILKDLTGSESAVVVNNNAAAVMLVLKSIFEGKELIIARGEMVEIGASFRIHEVMENSGVILKEVGATNKVYLKDYLSVISENTGAIMKVHSSNYRIKGFTHFVKTEKIVEAAHRNGLPVIKDLGSGILYDLSNYGLSPEPTVKEDLEAGIDILTFSGDKLLGGPQAGIIVGKEKYISQIESHPLMRALRIDKITLAALEETLRLYYDFDQAVKQIPTLNLITEKIDKVKNRAQKLYSLLKRPVNTAIEIIESKAKVGGGAYPLDDIDSFALSIGFSKKNINDFAYKLRNLETPVIARIEKNKLIFDLKTVKKDQIITLANAINSILSEVS